MPRTKGSKNRVKTDFDAQIAKLQKDKALLEEGVAKTVAQIALSARPLVLNCKRKMNKI